MNRSSPRHLGDDVEQLAAVLTGVLATGSPEKEARRAALRGATAILPAVLAMQQVQDWMRVQPGGAAWDGLLHRGCRMSPVPQGADVTANQREPGELVVRRVHRAGWELLWARTEVEMGTGCWHVTHELARRRQARQTVAVEGRKLTDRGTGFDPSTDVRNCRLTYDDVVAWAEATGDCNLIHLRPGRAAEAGLRVRPHDVAAHGLLVGALSLALVQSSHDQQIRLEFIGSVDVPASSRGGDGVGAALVVDVDNGTIVQEGRPVLRRR